MRSAPDRKAAATAAAGVSLVALTAAVISFSHVRRLAIEAGESALAAWLLPISIDGAIVAAVAVILADSRAGRRATALTWLLLGLGLAGSLAANIASAEPTMTARAVAAWPPVALALGIEVLASLARRRDEPQVGRESNSAGAAGSQAAAPSLPRELPESQRKQLHLVDRAGHQRRPGRRTRQEDAAAIQLIRQLDADSPTGQASRLEVQERLGCGGSRAARLSELARRSQPATAG